MGCFVFGFHSFHLCLHIGSRPYQQAGQQNRPRQTGAMRAHYQEIQTPACITSMNASNPGADPGKTIITVAVKLLNGFFRALGGKRVFENFPDYEFKSCK